MFDFEIVEYPVVDAQAHGEIVEMLGDEYTLMEKEFLLDARERLENLESCQQVAELEGLRKEAHYLVSSAGNMGFAAFSHSCRSLDESVRGGDLDGLDDQVKEIFSQFDKLLKALE